MSSRGRKPLPSTIKQLSGNPGRRPLNPAEPELSPGAPPRPEWLDAAASAEWDRIAAMLVDAGVISEAEQACLIGYCVSWSLMVEAYEKVREHGTVLVSPKTKMPFDSPYLNQLRSALKQMREFAAELGITPSSRSRVQALKRPDANDPMQELLAQITARRQHTSPN